MAPAMAHILRGIASLFAVVVQPARRWGSPGRARAPPLLTATSPHGLCQTRAGRARRSRATCRGWAIARPCADAKRPGSPCEIRGVLYSSTRAAEPSASTLVLTNHQWDTATPCASLRIWRTMIISSTIAA